MNTVEENILCLNCNSFLCIKCTSLHRNHYFQPVDKLRIYLENNNCINEHYFKKARIVYAEIQTGLGNLKSYVAEKQRRHQMGEVINVLELYHYIIKERDRIYLLHYIFEEIEKDRTTIQLNFLRIGHFLAFLYTSLDKNHPLKIGL
ncbi:hypothetical protein PPL_04735 [Heterostelium album PN500]|uniref:Uncharacterized protein n=1 Tax=Heterostelium pallidum (strain ATCC 26659 / Pp 5 / PN500) TaxID=670386 RepID=D3B8E2_HETP5|nr:hypothetical protein PPL_04735 [Heterostelium album PN500]EFA82310.1 hypothetical protein PPL_04735 [Heterostelium album PN500]|eukprot:XP_020434427.1 hypothetical protein PPL_04735 [Heterostelium album PN500]